jgi:hypothetical protein
MLESVAPFDPFSKSSKTTTVGPVAPKPVPVIVIDSPFPTVPPTPVIAGAASAPTGEHKKHTTAMSKAK